MSTGLSTGIRQKSLPAPFQGMMLKTRGEIESAICDGINRFEQEFLGRGATDIHAHLVGDIVFIRLSGVLTTAEKHLANSSAPERGRELIKQVRAHLIESARPMLDEMIQEATGAKVVTLSQEVNPLNDEQIIVAGLTESPRFRIPRR